MNSNSINLPRRNFMRVCAAGAGVAALGAVPDFSGRNVVKAAPLANFKRLVLVNLIGGNDGLNSVFPSSGSLATTYQSRRGTLALTAGQGLSLAGGPGVSDFHLHPALPFLQSVWNDGDLAIVQKVGYPNANLSHFVSEDIWSTGRRTMSAGSAAAGWIARYANLYAPTPTGVMSFRSGKRLDFDGATANPLLIGTIDGFKYESDFNYGNNHTLRLDTYGAMLNQQPATGLIGDIAAIKNAAHSTVVTMQDALTSYNAYAGGTGITYPTTTGANGFTGYLGRGLRDAAALIYGGFDTRILYASLPGGFDTHSGQEPRHTQLLTDLNDALAAFVADMKGMGIWNDTVVFVHTEFGRRNYLNGSDGTDHGHGNAVFVLGGPVSGGMYGDPPTVADLGGEHLPYTTDFRDIYRHILQDHLGHAAGPVFQESQPISKTLSFL